MSKKFQIAAEDIVRLIPHDGGCVATDRITVDGCEVGYMYREDPEEEGDTGWRFYAGDESEDYVYDLRNSDIHELNTIANYDPAILPHLHTDFPCAFEKVPGKGYFRRVES